MYCIYVKKSEQLKPRLASYVPFRVIGTVNLETTIKLEDAPQLNSNYNNNIVEVEIDEDSVEREIREGEGQQQQSKSPSHLIPRCYIPR